jgi:phosphate acyltransferase
MVLALPLALDAMGGDHAPNSVLEGAEAALLRHPGLKFLIYGKQESVAPLLASMPKLSAAAQFIDCETAISGDDKPSAAVRQGKNSSMRKAIDAVAEGKAFGVVSAGNTGALMAMSKIVLKTLPGINRPAIAALFPTQKGECVMLDLGANVECSAQDLFNFAVMGNAFAKAVIGVQRPKIGLLNIGSEDLKGHDEIKEAHAQLKDSGLDIDYYGFVEGNQVPSGVVDVVVTDGFTGNVALKVAEGTARLLKVYLKDAFMATLKSKIAAFLARSAMQAVRDKMDDRKRNGAMFLGLNGIAIKSHGAADAYSFANAITVAVELASDDVNGKIIAELKTYDETHPTSAADPFE